MALADATAVSMSDEDVRGEGANGDRGADEGVELGGGDARAADATEEVILSSSSVRTSRFASYVAAVSAMKLSGSVMYDSSEDETRGVPPTMRLCRSLVTSWSPPVVETRFGKSRAQSSSSRRSSRVRCSAGCRSMPGGSGDAKKDRILPGRGLQRRMQSGITRRMSARIWCAVLVWPRKGIVIHSGVENTEGLLKIMDRWAWKWD